MQHDYVLANASGAAFRADANDLAEAIATWNSGSSYPGTTFPRMRVANSTLGIIASRNIANSAWLLRDTDDETRVISRASNTMFDASDVTKVIKATSSFTQTFDAVATLGDWWHVGYIVDAGVTTVFDPNSTETIDGATTKTIAGPASGFIYGNGSALFTVGFIVPANSAEQQAGTSATTVVTPANQHFSKSAIQASGLANPSGTLQAGYNVTSVTDNGTGDITFTWDTDFAGNYAAAVSIIEATDALGYEIKSLLPGSLRILVYTLDAPTPADPDNYTVIATGAQ